MIVDAHVLNWPLVRLHNVRGGVGRRSPLIRVNLRNRTRLFYSLKIPSTMLSQIGDSHCPEMTHCMCELLSGKKIKFLCVVALVGIEASAF